MAGLYRMMMMTSLASVVAFVPAPLVSGASGFTAVIQGVTLQPGNCAGYPQAIVISKCDGTDQDYPGIRIKKYPSGSADPARVQLVEGANDTIELMNATITAVQSLQGEVTFWAAFDAPPTPTGGSRVQFDRVAGGNMRRGSYAAKDNWHKVTGYVNDNNTGDNEINTWQQKVVCCLSPTSAGSFSLGTSEVWDSGLGGTRVMKGRFWFYQQYAGDTLNLDYVRIKTSTIAGDPNYENIGILDGYSEEFITESSEDRIDKQKGRGRRDKGKNAK